MPTDFRDGTTFPRRGRTPLGGYLWLARVFDKGRAQRNGTLHDYVYPCGIDKGMFERWGITAEAFHQAVLTLDTDDEMLAWMTAHVSDERRDAANAHLLVERETALDKQDTEEGALAAV